MVSSAARVNPTTEAIFGLKLPIRSKMVLHANVASAIRTVSQPTKSKYVRIPGNLFPFMPNVARDKVIVGAFDFLPAKELIPTIKKLNIVPKIVARTICQKDILKFNTKEP